MKNILLLFLVFSFSNAQEIELGIGPGIISYPDYIGSKSNNILVLPFPYIRYVNPYFNIDEDGLNTKLLGMNRLSIKLSLHGSLPANTQNNSLREGMPDLGFTMEIGPNIIFKIYKQDFSSIELQLPIRTALSTNLKSLEYQGVRSNPHIQYAYETSNFEFIVRLGIIFSDKKYNAYFYDVEKNYATPSRPQYNSHSGFAGLRNKVGFTYKKDSWILGTSISHYNIQKAIFNNSPLVESKNSFYFKTFISYLFYKRD